MRDARPACRRPPATVAILMACVGLVGAGCSVKKYAVRQVGDALSSGTSVYETDPDLQLVGDALPFSLKLVESLLEITPRHRGLLVTASKGFALYSLAYVDSEGEMLVEEDFERGRSLRKRAKSLYLRSLGFSMRALERSYPGMGADLSAAPADAVRRVKRKDVDLLYWAGAALGLSISTDPTDPGTVIRLGEVDALLSRALELDESWDRGSLHEFRLRLESARPGGGDPEVIAASFQRALELSEGQSAGLFVAYAEGAAVPAQDRELFDEMIGKALAIDPDEFERYRLLNHLARRRALWLRSRSEDLFF